MNTEKNHTAQTIDTINIENVITLQQAFFNSNATKSIDFRKEQLTKLKAVIKANEQKLYDAIYKDFKKSQFETYLTELSIIYSEIDFFIKNIKKLSKPQKVATNLANLPSKSRIIPEPLGTVLVIGAWNYPIQLTLLPALTAMAAGNTVILKPSELAPHTARVIADIINSQFPCDYLYVHEGGVEETTTLLKHRFDKIFFTGSSHIGKIVYQAAAQHLTPVTLELGGKSPTFVFSDCNIDITAKRIVWAKFLNAGQTCVAPDYLLVEESIKPALLEALHNEIDKHYNDKSITENYLQIINDNHFERLQNLLNNRSSSVICGGYCDKAERFISPTIINDCSFDDEIMREEIFGPLLPVISFAQDKTGDNSNTYCLDDIIAHIKAGEKPLACYVFSKNGQIIDDIIRQISFGGGTVNDCVMHLSNHNLPFGGVGHSGLGSYHGKAGFECFSHYKSVMYRTFLFESNLKYTPYNTMKRMMLKWILG